MDFDKRIEELGLTLPEQTPPLANYVPYVEVGNLVFISGQTTRYEGELKYVGKVGQDFDLEEAQAAAKVCALNLLSQLKMACGGSLNKVKRCVRLGGFVNCVDSYKDQPKVVNGASDLMVEVFGDQGKHARAAVGVNALPGGIAVEIDGIFEISK